MIKLKIFCHIKNSMFKNVKIKRVLKKTIFPILTQINKVIPKNDKVILLYSANFGISHNLKPLKDYLLENKYDNKYKIICGIEHMKYADDDKRVKYVTLLQSIVYFFIARHVYYTTGQIPIKPSKNQIVIHLDHGTTAIKTVGAWSNIQNGDDFYFTYYTAPSQIYVPIIQKEYLCDKKNVVINGEPVNDILFKKHKKYNFGIFDKVGLWAPTFRQSDYLGYDDSSEDLLPMFSEKDYEKLNEKLKNYNIKLIVKLHDIQNLQGYNKFKYSNLDILSDKEFRKQGYELYALMTQIDFLLADYSSVFLQYLLLNKPIGFVIPDFEEYKERRGFIFENVLDYMPGPKIKTKEDLYQFLKDMANGIDEYGEERVKICDVIHKYQDGNSCARALKIGKIYK